MSENVTLRPVETADLILFDEAFAGPEGTGPFQWFGYSSSRTLHRRLAETGLIDTDGGMLAVTDGGACLGRVEWFKSAWGRADTSQCWTIAAGLLPAWRGRGIGSAAQRMLADYLFLHTRVVRIQAYTDGANLAEQRALLKAGFALEGVLRATLWRQGGWHDQLLYSRLRDNATVEPG
jgi:RimJ/RimL family protein N-acetyltransferase